MSKKSKKLSKQRNLQAKRSRKAANRLRFQELARLGENNKSTRFKRSSLRRKLAKTIDHPNGPCGNIGCKKCNHDAGRSN